MLDKFLPVGAVVKLSQDTNKVMIVGYLPKSTSSGKSYDYFGVLFPYGYKNDQNFVLFNHDQIIEVCYIKTNLDSNFVELNNFLKNNNERIS